jgi:hypothetical protein
MKRWAQHFYETLNSKDYKEIREEVMYQRPEVQTELPIKNEVWEIIRMLKNNTSAEENNISAELNKYEDKKLWAKIHALIGLIWTSERSHRNGALQ